MWSEGKIAIPNGANMSICQYIVKHGETPSKEKGIDGGKILKLQIIAHDKRTAEWNEGAWEIEPEEAETKLAYMICLQKFS